MEDIDKMLKVCNSFIYNEYSIEEFQSRLYTVLLPETTEIKNTLEKSRQDALNEIEAIEFCHTELEANELAKDIATTLINAITAYTLNRD